MQQRWILDEVLDNGPSDGTHRPGTLRATTIDTATEETWHEDQAEAVEATVQAAVERAEHVSGGRPLEFKGPTIIPDELPTGRKNELLTASNPIANLRSEVGLNSWWLENGRDPLDNVNNKRFDSGVDQLRSVSKALFHITQQKSVNCDPVAVPPEGEVCIVTSLGGGTGSGLAIDLAASLREAKNDVETVDLYGILPHSDDEATARANAYATLSELEYAELAGESPFDSITLLPHLEAVEEKNAEFEMAAVRTILARQNGGKSVDKLRPNQASSLYAPAYAPFTIASPVTLQYDLAIREEALEVVKETLQAKRQELEAENALYDTLEQYLKNAFPDTAGAEFAGGRGEGRLEFDDGDQRPLELQRRIEDDLWGEFLEDATLRVANLGKTVDLLDEVFEEVCNNEAIGIQNVSGNVERANAFVDAVPERLDHHLEFGLTEQDENAYRLVETVRQEVRNVAKRRDIYRAVSRITADEEPSLTPMEAGTIRIALADVVLDEEIRFLSSEIMNPRFREMIDKRKRELDRYEEGLTALEQQYEAVVDEIERLRGEWYAAVQEEAKRLAAIKRNEQAVTTTLNNLAERIQQKCCEINNADRAELDRIELDLDQIGPRGLTDECFDGIVPLNEELDSMGIEPIPVNEIEDGFESVKRARGLELTHHGILPWSGNQEEFKTAARRAEESGLFSVNKDGEDTAIENEFICSFHAEKFDLEEEIDAAMKDAIDAIAEAFVAVFTEGGDAFRSYKPGCEHGVDAPQEASPETVRTTLKSSLEASTETDPDDLLHDVMPASEIDPSEPSAEPLSASTPNGDTMEQISDTYLRPIGEQYEAVRERYDMLVDDEHVPGLLSRMKALRAIAEGRDVGPELGPGRPVSVDVPDPADRQFDSMSGNEFAERYDGIYEFDLDDSFKYEGNQNPYVVPMETEPADLTGDPADIADTDILESRSDEIEAEFRRETARLIRNGKRAPYEVSIRGNGEKSKDDQTAYKQHRIRQVYLSRAFEDVYNVGKRYDKVYEQYRDQMLPLEGVPEMYGAETHPHGWVDDVTMVTFVGGIFLDNISLVSEPGGYRDAYQNTYDIVEFSGSHHTIGLGAMWDRWSLLSEWVTEEWEEANPESDADFGGFVYRDEVYDPNDQSFVEEIKYRNDTDGESAADLFLDALTADAYESTIQVDQQDTDEPGFQF